MGIDGRGEGVGLVRRGSLLASLLLAGCASTPRPAAVTAVPPTPRVADCSRFASALDGALSEPSALPAMGVALRPAAGERTIGGDAATDERVSEVRALGCVGDSALGLVRTDCGNATLVSYTGRSGTWAPRAHLSLVDAGRPGSCVRSAVEVTAVALTIAAPREFAVETEVASDDGDEGSGRSLRVARLGDDGALDWYAGEVRLGSFDEATGAETRGRWDVIDELPVPRDLYVEQRPLHGGLGGEAIGSEIRRETWRVRERALERIDVTRERVRPPPAAPRALP